MNKSIQKVNPISDNDYSKWLELTKQAEEAEYAIETRIGYILDFFLHQFDMELEYWHFSGAEEGETGSLSDHVYDKYFISDIEFDCCYEWNDPTIIDQMGKIFTLENEIPKRWLHQDFEQEVIDGKAKYQELLINKAKEKKIKANNRKAKKESLIESAKSKLSPEELDALLKK